MILTCPECATRYFVEDQRLGSAGRTVRCASCGSAWRAHNEEPLELTNSAEEGAVARVASEPLSFKPIENPQLSDLSAPELPKSFRAKAVQKRKVREAAAAGVVWGLMCAGFAVLLGGAYLFRVDVVKLYPRAAGAYAMVGVPVNPTGLEFENIKAAPAPDGLAAVTVTGVIRNVTAHASAPPPIRVALLDKAGGRMATQVMRLAPGLIGPGKTRPFSISLPDPKASAADVDVNFALDLMPKSAPRAAAAARPRAPAPQPLRVATAPAPASQAVDPGPGLRPALGAPVKAEEAKPLASGDPYALHPAAKAAAPPHG
jgi:predicted Zn finger-like uncharacterized protein